MKSKLFAIILSICLIMPAYTAAEEQAVVQSETAQEEVADSQAVQNEDSLNAEESESVSDKELAQTPYKHPVSKRKLAKKFLKAMLGVLVSSLVIFAGLSIYNKFREAFGNSQQAIKSEEYTPLTTPDNLTDAVKSFMDKTNWK